MLINYNGIVQENHNLVHTNLKGFRSGAFLHEPFTIRNRKVIKPEGHYFNLLASMRILRLTIPLEFTEEFVLNECYKLLSELKKEDAELDFVVFKDQIGNVSFIVQKKEEKAPHRIQNLEIYKEYTVGTKIYDCLNTPRPAEYVGKIYADENDFDDLILLNADKKISRSLYGDVLLAKGSELSFVPESDGRLRNAALSHFTEWIKRQPDFTAKEVSSFPFELTQCSSIAILTPNYELVPVVKLRKHDFDVEAIVELSNRFNADLFG